MTDMSSTYDLSGETLQRRLTELSSLNIITRAVTESLKVTDVVNSALDQIIITVKPDLAVVFLRTGDRLDLAGSRAINKTGTSLEMPVHEVGRCLCGLAVTADRAIFSMDIHGDPRCEWNECKVFGIQSAAALPLRTRDGILGVLTLASVTSRDFEQESEFIETLAGQIAVGVNNALMCEQIQKQAAIQQELVNDKIRLQADLEMQIERFRQVAESSGVWIWEIDADGLYQYSCPAVEQILGYSADEIVGKKHLLELFVQDDRNGLNKSACEIMAQKKGFKELPVTKIHKNGRIIMLESSGFPMLDKNGDFKGYRGSDIDVTERKMSEEALRRTQFAVDTSRDAIFLVKRDAGLAYVNEAACRSLCYTKDELLSLSVFDFDPEFPKNKWYEYWDQYNHLESYLIETVHMTRNGHRFPVEISVNPIRFGGEEYRFSYARDITMRKEAELLLKESELKFRTVVRDAQAIIFILDDHGVFLLSEGQELAKIGLQPGQVIGMSAFELYRDNPGVIEALTKSLSGELTRVTSIVQGVVFDVVYSPYYNVSGKQSGVIGVAIDITERIRAEREKEALQLQLLQAQKMESVARLAGGVAHDFNNMLSAILGHAQLAMIRSKPSEPIVSDLKAIENSALRSAELIRQLLAFARRQTVAPQVLDLNHRITGMLKLLKRMIGEDVDLVWSPGADLWPVKIDPSQIDQLLANLCVNARDAIAGIGKVTVETGNTAFDKAYCDVHTGFTCGEYVMLAVSDNGCGISKEVMGNIFEPFFTTKDVGKGTGLGLATVYGIVKQNYGLVNVYSEPDNGSTFKIYLPRFVGEAAESTAEITVEMRRGRGETVLLVEDEAIILNVGKEMLEELGYTVLTACTPDEALLQAIAHVAEIQLLITDVVMPEMNGRDLAKSISDIKPGLKCLFTSGYTSDVIAHHGVLDEDVHFLQKPFSMNDLAFKVNNALEQK